MGGPIVTTQFAPWHWQDKFDAQDPDDANRQQLLNVEKQISFTKWLKLKRTNERRRQEYVAAALAAKREEAQKERDAKEKECKEHKRRQREDARQRREERAARELADARQREAAREKSKRARTQHDKVNRAYTDIMRTALLKPEPASARPTFKQWAAKKKRESRKAAAATSMTPTDTSRVQPSTGKDARAAYESWLERKQMEDRVKHKMAAEANAKRELEAKLAHERAWQKKAIVCAYSQNRSEKAPAWRAATLSLLS